MTKARRDNLHPSAKSDIIPVPDLIAIQRDSYKRFVAEGLKQELQAISPIVGYNGRYELEFLDGYTMGEPEHTLEECRIKEMTYSAPLRVSVRLVDKETGEVKQQEVFMGDIPMMTVKGTFLINGAERVVVSQFVRSPGVYFQEKIDKQGIRTVGATVIPNRGAWFDIEIDKHRIIYSHINKMKKIPFTLFLGALGYEKDQVMSMCKAPEYIERTLEKGDYETCTEARHEIYRKLRPGDPLTDEGAKLLLKSLFFDEKKYDLGKVGRYKLNKRLALDIDGDKSVLTNEDILAIMNELIDVYTGEGLTDDIDHLGNRRVRSVGELMQLQFRVGLARLERLIKEQMAISEPEKIVPQNLINIRPLVSVMREFFGSSQLSQFMDQTNPLAEMTHRRRLSALGPGGLTKERAGYEVRDIHPSHYGRICVIETPEGPNAGLIGPLGTYARVNEFGFVETPYRKVVAGKVTDEIEFLTADIEDRYRLAPYDVGLTDDNKLSGNQVPVRYKKEFIFAIPDDVDYIGVSPRQLLGITTSLIPFLEHDDANRALMGANMQRQATPLMRPERPFVGTGMEKEIARYSGGLIIAQEDGEVVKVNANEIVIGKGKKKREYNLLKYQRSNQNTCINQKPIVKLGEMVKAGDPIADGPSTNMGELSLGRNILVAFMPWEGYNFEDSILISEKLVIDDMFSTVHINKFEIDVRTTKLGDEELTREIPNVSEEAIKELDERGIIRIGAEVKVGNILVGKVTPKGETEPPAEEKLLRAIFGDKARDMRDTSLKVPSGEGGKVVDVRVFSRENNDKLPSGVNVVVRVYVAQIRKISIGDKVAGRHGNKGVISRILPVEDMPMLPDGTPLDMVLNPLGVPSRMNVGQIYETILGGAAWAKNRFYECPSFDEALEEDASEKAIRRELTEASQLSGFEWMNSSGTVSLRDGRSGDEFDRKVTVGKMYMLKLIHLVDDKIHARSTGPYSLVTQQPLGGKAQFGGQRFGEMEVWALEAYGAAHLLQELLTIKSDDVTGRAKAYEAIIKGKPIQKTGTPESFRVLLRELRSIALDVKVLDEEGIEIDNR